MSLLVLLSSRLNLCVNESIYVDEIQICSNYLK